MLHGAKIHLIGNLKLIRSGGLIVYEKGSVPLSTRIHNKILKKIKDKDRESLIIKDAGKNYLVGFSQIKLTKGGKEAAFGGTFESIDHKKGNKGESWYILCFRRKKTVMEPIFDLIKSIILTGSIIVLILALASYLFGRRIAAPLAKLKTATENIGKGDFNIKLKWRKNDEIGNLGRSFNDMAKKLLQTTTSIDLLNNEITERINTEKVLSETLKENKYLLRELQHRAKNSFAMICSMVTLMKDTSSSDGVKFALDEVGSRIIAISEMYDLLYETDSVTEVRLDKYLIKIASTMPIIPQKITFKKTCDKIIVPIKTAIPVGIITSELLTNSIKHAFPESKKGTISLIVKKTNKGANVEVKDDGAGIPEGIDISTINSLGLKLIHGLTMQIEGNFQIDGKDGTHSILKFPIN